MSTFIKKYPRARISPHPTLNGWIVDLLLRAGAKPIKVNARYATIDFAHKAALVKLGVKPHAAALANVANPKQQEWKEGPGRTPVPAKVADTTQSGPVPRGAARTNPGVCKPCGRPMRPAGTKASDHPGTTLRQREGLCQSCSNSQKRETA